MMSRSDPALARRLENLTGEDGAACIATAQDEADELRASDVHAQALLAAKALSDENRLLLAMLLKRRGEQCACELQAALSLTHATISHHTRCLAEAGLIAAERRGKFTYYTLTARADGLVP